MKKLLFLSLLLLSLTELFINAAESDQLQLLTMEASSDQVPNAELFAISVLVSLSNGNILPVATQADNQILTCQICQANQEDTQELEKHMRRSHKTYRCENCFQIFNTEHKDPYDSYRNHKNRVHGKQYQCTICFKNGNRLVLLDHLKKNPHGEDTPSIQDCETDQKLSRAVVSSRQRKTELNKKKLEMAKEKNSSHQDQPPIIYQCIFQHSFCYGQQMTTQQELLDHCLREHQIGQGDINLEDFLVQS